MTEPDVASAADASDAEVIAEILVGAHARFAVLVRRHNQPVYRACRAVLRNDQDAEDAVQAAWLNAFRALHSFRSESSFRTWITRIAINESTTRLRKQRQLVPTEELTMRDSQNPESELVTKELSLRLEREIDALPEGLRSVLVLRDVIELDTKETGECLGIEDENVRVRLHRARQALALRLAEPQPAGGRAEALEALLPDVWRFDGDRCANMLARVMQLIAR